MKVRTFTTPVSQDQITTARLVEFRGSAAYNEAGTFLPDETTLSATFELLTSSGEVVLRETVRDVRTWADTPASVKVAVQNLVALLMQSPSLPAGVDVDQ